MRHLRACCRRGVRFEKPLPGRGVGELKRFAPKSQQALVNSWHGWCISTCTDCEEAMAMRTSAATARIQTVREAGADAVVETTLLELVTTLGEITEDDREVVSAVVELLRTGRVRLIGNFRGQKLALA